MIIFFFGFLVIFFIFEYVDGFYFLGEFDWNFYCDYGGVFYVFFVWYYECDFFFFNGFFYVVEENYFIVVFWNWKKFVGYCYFCFVFNIVNYEKC